MKNDLEYVFESNLIINTKENEKIYNELKFNNKLIEEVEVENIPLCLECFLEDEKGKYICKDCKINLCTQHVKEHLEKFQIYLLNSLR